MKFLRREILQLAGGLAACVAAGPAWAETYPTRPVKIIVPYPPGGPTDLVARILAAKLGGLLGQTVVVENANNPIVGVGRIARSAPDGYTLGVGNNGSNVLNGAFHTLPYDLIKDFEPIARLTTNPQIIITRKSIPAKNLKELLVWLKANQSKVSVGSAGGVATVSAVHFQNMTHTKFTLVPYRGAAPAIQDLMAGRIDLMFDQLSNALPHVRAGTVKGFAVAASVRSPSAPEIPTTDEAGLPGFYGSLWQGLWAPKGTPPAIIAKLNAAVMAALADPAMKQRLAHLGQEVLPVEQQKTAVFAAFQKAEVEKWYPIVKAANLKAD